MEAFMMQGVDLLGGEVDVDHRRRPSGISWRTESGDEFTTCIAPGQSSTFSRDEYKLLGMIPHFRKEKVTPEVSTCLVGMRVFAIDPRGVVRSCDEFAPLGDLTRQSAREIWTGAEARVVRRGTVACTKGCAYGCLATKSLAEKIRR